MAVRDCQHTNNEAGRATFARRPCRRRDRRMPSGQCWRNGFASGVTPSLPWLCRTRSIMSTSPDKASAAMKAWHFNESLKSRLPASASVVLGSPDLLEKAFGFVSCHPCRYAGSQQGKPGYARGFSFSGFTEHKLYCKSGQAAVLAGGDPRRSELQPASIWRSLGSKRHGLISKKLPGSTSNIWAARSCIQCLQRRERLEPSPWLFRRAFECVFAAEARQITKRPAPRIAELCQRSCLVRASRRGAQCSPPPKCIHPNRV